MRHFLISALLLSLVYGCSSVNLGPHRIDVQQGNALDQENVARLKPGLNRSQVRFLLGTPLVVDPFRTDRWDYVYVFYKAGKLAEQKRISLFFDGETLARIEGDYPVAEPVGPPSAKSDPKPEPRAESGTPTVAAETRSLPAPMALKAEPIPVTQSPAHQPAAQTAAVEVAPRAVVRPSADKPAAAQTSQPVQSREAISSIVPPLPSPKNAPSYIDPRPPAELSLRAETDVVKIQPEAIPAFPGVASAPADSDAPVLKSLNEWADAWARRDKTAYLAAYDDRFIPQDGGSRAEWENRKRHTLDAAKNIAVRVESPRVERTEEGIVTVTFNQYYQSGNYRDAVVKRLHMVERDGRWLIVEEKVLSTLRGTKQ